MSSLLMQDLQNYKAGTLDVSLLETLAAIGGGGSSPQNCQRDMLANLPKPKLPTMKPLEIFLEHSVFGVASATSGIIWPHEMFAHLYHFHREAFFAYVMPGREVLHKFWTSVQGGWVWSYCACLTIVMPSDCSLS